MKKALRQRPSFDYVLYYSCVNPALFTQTLYLSAVCLVWKKVSGSVYSMVAHPSSTTEILKGRGGKKKTSYSTSMYVCKDGEEEVSNNVLFPLAK